MPEILDKEIEHLFITNESLKKLVASVIIITTKFFVTTLCKSRKSVPEMYRQNRKRRTNVTRISRRCLLSDPEKIRTYERIRKTPNDLKIMSSHEILRD